MERTRRADEIVYTSRTVGEVQLAKMILKFLNVNFTTGASVRGETIHISPDDDKKFQDEVIDWENTARYIHNSFRQFR